MGVFLAGDLHIDGGEDAGDVFLRGIALFDVLDLASRKTEPPCAERLPLVGQEF